MPEPPDREAWEKQREDFADELLDLLADPTCKVFFGDQTRFEDDPRSRQKWVRRGTRHVHGYDGGHLRNVIGAVNPASGQLVSLIVPHCDTEVFQAFLDTMATEAAGKKANGSCSFSTTPAGTRTKGWTGITSSRPTSRPTARTSTASKGSGSISKATTSRASSRRTGALGENIFQFIRSLLQTPETIRSVCRTHSQ